MKIETSVTNNGCYFNKPITITFEPEEIATLWHICNFVGGDPKGPRKYTDELRRLISEYYRFDEDDVLSDWTSEKISTGIIEFNELILEISKIKRV